MDVEAPLDSNIGPEQAFEAAKEYTDLGAIETPEVPPEGIKSYALPDHIRDRFDELDLPYGYALIGGGARAITTEMLTGHIVPVRDIDIAAFTEYSPDQSRAHEIAKRLMPDDYTFGHGVQFSSLYHYFTSRDFTMNEVAVVNNQLLMTDQAEHDLRHNIVRPTTFEHDPTRDWHLSPKLAIKAVLMRSMLEQSTGVPANIEGIDLRNYRCDLTGYDDEDDWTRPFFVALGFQKALEYGDAVANDFLDKLLDYGMLNTNSLKYRGALDDRLASFAEEVATASDFEFRGVAADRLIAIRQMNTDNYSLGDLLHAVGGDEFEQYVHYHELAQKYGGKGRQYTDEAKY